MLHPGAISTCNFLELCPTSPPMASRCVAHLRAHKQLSKKFVLRIFDKFLVAWAVVSQVLFARFRTVEHINKRSDDVIVVQKKFQLSRNVHFLWVGLVYLLFTSHGTIYI